MYFDIVNSSVVRHYGEEFPLLMPRWGYVASAFILFMIGFFGFFLNLMVILLMMKDKQLWTPLNMVLFNLVCSDFCVSVFGNPFTLISALFHRWVFGQTMCVLYGFFMALFGIASITSLTVLAFERYMLVSRPLDTGHLSSKSAALIVVFIWVYSLALTIPPLLGWGNYVSEAANISCSVNWHEQSFNTLTYILYLFAMGQIIPMAVIIFSYVNIVRTIKENSQRVGKVSRAESKVTVMVFVMIISFTVAWTPYSVFALMEQFATEGIVSPGAGVIPALIAKSSICYDPLIYVGMNTQFRQAIKRVFGIRSRGILSQTERGYDNTLMSPSHRMSRVNDTIIKRTNSEIMLSNALKKNVVISDNKEVIIYDNFEIQNDGQHICDRLSEKSLSKTDTSNDSFEEILLREVNNYSKRTFDSLEVEKTLKKIPSPTSNVTLSDKPLLSKTPLLNKPFEMVHDLDDLYGNKAFESHPTDIKTGEYNYKKINQSLSLDLVSTTNKKKKRKLSIGTKADQDVQSEFQNSFVLLSKFKEGTEKKNQRKSYETYLFIDERNINEEVL